MLVFKIYFALVFIRGGGLCECYTREIEFKIENKPRVCFLVHSVKNRYSTTLPGIDPLDSIEHHRHIVHVLKNRKHEGAQRLIHYLQALQVRHARYLTENQLHSSLLTLLEYSSSFCILHS